MCASSRGNDAADEGPGPDARTGEDRQREKALSQQSYSWPRMPGRAFRTRATMAQLRAHTARHIGACASLCCRAHRGREAMRRRCAVPSSMPVVPAPATNCTDTIPKKLGMMCQAMRRPAETCERTREAAPPPARCQSAEHLHVSVPRMPTAGRRRRGRRLALGPPTTSPRRVACPIEWRHGQHIRPPDSSPQAMHHVGTLPNLCRPAL